MRFNISIIYSSTELSDYLTVSYDGYTLTNDENSDSGVWFEVVSYDYTGYDGGTTVSTSDGSELEAGSTFVKTAHIKISWNGGCVLRDVAVNKGIECTDTSTVTATVTGITYKEGYTPAATDALSGCSTDGTGSTWTLTGVKNHGDDEGEKSGSIKIFIFLTFNCYPLVVKLHYQWIPQIFEEAEQCRR